MEQNTRFGMVLGRLVVLKFLDWAVKYATFECNLVMFPWAKKIIFEKYIVVSVCTKKVQSKKVRKPQMLASKGVQNFWNPNSCTKVWIICFCVWFQAVQGLKFQNKQTQKQMIQTLKWNTMRKSLLNLCHLVSISKNVMFYAFLVVRIY